MTRTAALLALLAVLVSPPALAAGKPVELTAADGVKLRATYHSPGKPGPGIVLLHMCNSDRRAWDGLGARLAAAGFHALALDYRGFGESGGPRYAEPANRAALVEKWPADIDRAFDHLVAQPGVQKDRIGVAGGSCGVHQAIQLASRRPQVKTAVLLAGNTNAAGEAFVAKSSWMPLLGVASRDDARSEEQMAWLLGFSSNPLNQLEVYDKGGHGTELFAVHADLEPAIVAWFTRHLVAEPAQPTAASRPGPSFERAAELRKPGAGTRLLAARRSGKAVVLPPEAVLNAIGYELVQGKRVEDGIQIFLLNVEAHPDSANVYDSAADGYLAAGDAARAKELARKALDALARDRQTPELFKEEIRRSAEGKLK